MLNIRYEKTTNPKEIPGEDNPLQFGTIFTDHMFIMNYETGKGWFDPRIVPYQPLKMEPSSMVFHYGQEMFEGLKAYKTKDGRTLLFRPNKNIERANNTNRRICSFYEITGVFIGYSCKRYAKGKFFNGGWYVNKLFFFCHDGIPQ